MRKLRKKLNKLGFLGALCLCLVSFSLNVYAIGSITVNVEEDRFLIHCLDESFDVGTEGFEMEDRILAIEGKQAPHSAAKEAHDDE